MTTQSNTVFPSILGALPLTFGGAVRYLGRADSVYEQLITLDGVTLPEQPYAPWSKWVDSDAYAAIEAAQRSFCALCYYDLTDACNCDRPDCQENGTQQ